MPLQVRIKELETFQKGVAGSRRESQGGYSEFFENLMLSKVVYSNTMQTWKGYESSQQKQFRKTAKAEGEAQQTANAEEKEVKQSASAIQVQQTA